ncbi:protein TonB [Nitrosospira multiformis ATCC 25196]|uniref:Protein TonB n=1 Tax=Nitrosospira multiformis (strain ATCC 25196 / NCIMB 11849 / C 71) TaxID=323848 RepID=Q2YBM6_NITMU|nr:energy transducer TonB [Nitrosospira multiformis]ABB73845.1 TonB-like protein [Nitrosospira multiformis ATCC 25196]SEF43284.1 protein TonB [Nitrosospira multiformis ATCC 25196]
MSASPTITTLNTTLREFKPDASYSSPLNRVSRLKTAILVSVILHVVVLSGVTFKFPLPQIRAVSAPLEVMLVNREPALPPAAEDRKEALPRVARASPAVKGNASRHPAQPSLPLPKQEDTANIPGETIADSAAAVQEAGPRELRTPPLMAAPENDSHQSADEPDPLLAPAQPQIKTGQDQNAIFDTADLVQRGLAIARVAARGDASLETYQKPLKRKFIGSRTRDYRFARYAEDWRLKVERIGNLNYPEAAKREQLYGSLQLTVGIRSDGSLESVEINRSSGKKILDQAAVRIVKLAGQNGFAPFPPELSRDTDILHITRSWVFTSANELTSE